MKYDLPEVETSIWILAQHINSAASECTFSRGWRVVSKSSATSRVRLRGNGRIMSALCCRFGYQKIVVIIFVETSSSEVGGLLNYNEGKGTNFSLQEPAGWAVVNDRRFVKLPGAKLMCRFVSRCLP